MELTVIQDDIRKHTAFLLGIPEDGTLAKKVTRDQADAYDPLRHELPCTAEDFKLHLEGTPAHPWNKAATKVFVRSFCTKYPHQTAHRAESHFKVHIDTLIRKYRTQELTKDDPDAKAAAKKKNRKNARKVTVSPFPTMRESAVLNLTTRSSSRIARGRFGPSLSCTGTPG